MAKKQQHGGKRRNAGRTPLNEGDKLTYVFLKGVKIKASKLKEIGKPIVKLTAETAAQKAVDKL